MLKSENAGFNIGGKWLVKNISFNFDVGKCYMICGPNGAGKSTLLKLLSLQLQPSEGNIFYNDIKVDYSHQESYARNRAVLSQQLNIGFPMQVDEIIMMGRYPHFKVRPSQKDKDICKEVIYLQKLEPFLGRDYNTLSGGEKQRVQFARIMAQIWDTSSQESNRVLLLDEPISSLDIKQQFEFLHTVTRLMNEHTTIIAILHDLNLALNFSDEILLLQQGELFATGSPGEVLTTENIQKVFDIHTDLIREGDIQLLWPSKNIEI